MAYETIPDLDCVKAVSLGGTRLDKKTGKRYKNPTQIEGYFVGTKGGIENKKNPEKPNNLHIFQTEEGNVGVWGRTDLDNQMRRAKVGLMTLAQFTGMVPTNKNPMYKYLVKQDPLIVNTEIAAAGLQAVAVEASLEEAVDSVRGAPIEEGEEEVLEEEAFEEEAALEEEEPALDEAPVTRAKAPAKLTSPSADRQAATQRLLAGAKKSA